MRNIPVLSVLVIIVCAFYPNNSAHCREENPNSYALSLSPQFGFVHGQALELVYPGNTRGEFLSELTWEMKPVYYLGLQADFHRFDLTAKPGLFGSVRIKAGFPGDSGIHENRDWQSIENNGLTDFSRHTNRTREFYWLDINIGASFPVKSMFYIMPFLSGSWMRFAFTGRDGNGVYARKTCGHTRNSLCICGTYYPIDDNPVEWDFSGDVIRYEQRWLAVAAGIKAGTRVFDPFSFDLLFQISPFTHCAAIDEHLIGNMVYIDYTGFGLFIEPVLNLAFYAKPVELSLDIAYRRIGKTRGKTYIKEINGGIRPISGEAGAALSLIDFSFLLRLYIP